MTSSPLRTVLCSGLCLLTVAGCRLSLLDLDPVTPELRTFELAPAPIRPVTAASWCAGKVAMVETFDSDRKYDERLYGREGSTSVERSETCRWAQPPADMLSARVLDAVLQSGLFGHVVGPRSPIRPDVRITGHVLAFEQVREKGGGAGKAVLRLVMALSVPDKGEEAGGVLWQRTLALEKALTADHAEAFVEAMSANVADALAQVVQALPTIRPER